MGMQSCCGAEGSDLVVKQAQLCLDSLTKSVQALGDIPLMTKASC